MADATEVIRQQMEETRGALSEKLETLEGKVTDAVQVAADAVQTATDVVQGTVESVKDGVQDTVDSVKQTISLSAQMERRPWVMVAGSVAVGFAAGKLLGSWTQRRPSHRAPVAYQPQSLVAAAPVERYGHGNETNWLGWMETTFGPEIEKLKELAIGTTMSLVRDLATKSAPESLGTHIKDAIDGFTHKLGGKPVEGSLLPQEPAEVREPAGPRL
jgi:ElaB/YqjD/DUF883 family membrane-anchored ribosome-binding protein